MNRSVAIPLSVLLVTAVIGCGDPDTSAAEVSGVAVDTLGGVVWVRYSGPSAALSLASGPSIGGTEGEAGGPSPDVFGQIRSVIADESGEILVADNMALEIRAFDSTGSFLWSMGGEGAGPGEFGGVHGIAWLKADTFVAVDYGNARLTRMTTAGDYVGQWSWMPLTGGIRFLFNGGPHEFYVHGIRGAGTSSRSMWLEYGPSGVVDSLEIPRPEEEARNGIMCRGNGIGFFSNPVDERFIAIPAPAGERVVARSSDYRVTFLNSANDTIKVVTRDVTPIPLADSVWAVIEDDRREFLRQWAGAECEGAIERPSHARLVHDVYFDHDGGMMVEYLQQDGMFLDLFRPGGELRGTIRLPAERDRSVPPFLRGDHLYLVTKDELDVQQVQVYRVH